MAQSSSSAHELETTMRDPRYVRGVSLLQEKRYEEAVDVWGDYLRTLCEVEGKRECLGVAPVYYEYGHALLSVAETSGQLFGGPLDAADDHGDANEAVAEDLETAWQVMEVARVIYARYPDDAAVEAQLARVHTRLGDLSLESEQFDQAKAEFQAALKLRRKLLQATNARDTTQLADLYCQLAITCLYRDATETQGEARDREREEVVYYAKAGHIMATNIHRIAEECNEHVQQVIKAWIPVYDTEADERVDGPSKRNASGDAAWTVSLKKPHPETLRPELLACVHVTEDALDTVEPPVATLLEYVAIYLELKEKVDALHETKPRPEAPQGDTTRGSTTVGFPPPLTPAPANVVAVKKRKTAASPSCD
ncbi:hypothetical protein PsorP6_016463 [Peronosclerospora sorghi]|uniref:Uncharacterized protein n=1 Tax=Peronosclerospora sorghi TaxID=230839 RepID=A0ACC0VLY6_9STRA|nr:hypothetical protein PsorP6_016463 [Peronosclerospora sorghi]